MSGIREINVHIGEVKSGRPGQRLKALLGSCVGVAIVWRDRRKCALAHCLLADAPDQSDKLGGRFVTQAIPSMLAMLRARPENYPELVAIVAGGSNMTSVTTRDPKSLVGTVNVETAIRLLNKLKITIIHQAVGGQFGRTIAIDCETGNFEIQELPRVFAA